MPGYRLIQAAARAAVAETTASSIGFLDFLRELQEDPFPFAKFSHWSVAGLEEVLFAARPADKELACEIHRQLNRAAPDLEKRLLDVQIVFTGQIIRGADLVVSYRGASLPIGLIFNHPQQKQDAHGNVYYPMEFHLSSP